MNLGKYLIVKIGWKNSKTEKFKILASFADRRVLK